MMRGKKNPHLHKRSLSFEAFSKIKGAMLPYDKSSCTGNTWTRLTFGICPKYLMGWLGNTRRDCNTNKQIRQASISVNKSINTHWYWPKYEDCTHSCFPIYRSEKLGFSSVLNTIDGVCWSVRSTSYVILPKNLCKQWIRFDIQMKC